MAKIILNRPSIYEYAGIVLIAGENEVTTEQLAVLLPSKGLGVRADVDAGVLTVVEDKPAPKPKSTFKKDESK